MNSSGVYQSIDRASRHKAHRRHPYAHHIRRLHATLRVLVGDLRLPTDARILDYGCAEKPYRPLFLARADYVGADLPGNPAADLVINPDGTVPLGDQSFDLVLSTQVLEHVSDPDLYLRECLRLLRPGGRLLLTTHGIFAYHPDPVDLWRWTCEGLQEAVRRTGFEIDRFEGVVGLAATGLQLLQDAISYRIPHHWVPRLALVMQPLVAFADRFETPQTLGYHAQVFALVARRPN